MKLKRSRILALLASSLPFVSPVNAGEANWGAEDIRQIVRDYFINDGRTLPADTRIGPLDDRMQVNACAIKPTVQPRSAYSSSLVVSCSGPTSWSFTLRVEGIDALPVASLAQNNKTENTNQNKKGCLLKKTQYYLKWFGNSKRGEVRVQ